MRRKFLGMPKILVMVLVFGLGLVLTSCGEQTVDIHVRNDSDWTVAVYFVRRADGLDSSFWFSHVAPGVTVSRHYSAGNFSVRVVYRHALGSATWHHPMPAGQFRQMSGTVNLTFTGDRIH